MKLRICYLVRRQWLSLRAVNVIIVESGVCSKYNIVMKFVHVGLNIIVYYQVCVQIVSDVEVHMVC